MKTPLLLATTVWMFTACCSTPAILDSKGIPVPGSIAVLEPVLLNGRTEWITLRGRDQSNPVLLFFAGGPGASELVTIRETLGRLEDSFVVVVWDQPGAGKSYPALPHSQLTLDIYLEDGCELIRQLCQRFHRQKIILVGESWGSFLAVRTAQRVPDSISAIFGTGQMVDFLETDRACYQLSLDWAVERKDQEQQQRLLRQGPPPYSGPGVAVKVATFLGDSFEFMKANYGIQTGGNVWRDLGGPEYSLIDQVNWFRGLWDSLEQFYPTLWGQDLRKTVPRIQVPLFFFMGRYDRNSSIPLVEEYYALLQAPRKEIVWFERSGHTPWSSEPRRFVDELVQRAVE